MLVSWCYCRIGICMWSCLMAVCLRFRLPFSCERCNWGSRATAIRKCRRCGWCEPGSKEETEAWEQVCLCVVVCVWKPGSRCVCVWLCVCVESMRLSTEWLSGAMLEHIYIHIYTHLSTASSLSCVRYLSIPPLCIYVPAPR